MGGKSTAEAAEDGSFQRQEDAFRDWVSADAAAPYPAEPGRYHLYVSLACPWANRTVIVRNLLGLQEAIGMTVVDPVRDGRGWAFRDGPGYSTDPVNGFAFLREAYLATMPSFTGRVTVPALWDKKTRRIVNNSEDDLCRMFQNAFAALARKQVDLFPKDIQEEQSQLSHEIYEKVNNCVYRAGFATQQKVYAKECRILFTMLDALEQRLESRRYLFGDRIVETDWRLFHTLVRFDPVYYGHFKCNVRRIFDYPNLQGYLLDLYQQPGVAETIDFEQIKRHYYMSQEDINPTRIVPLGPALDLTLPHGRERLSAKFDA